MNISTVFIWLFTAALSYCIGSISTGILVSKAFHGPDLHTVGSKSTGATNVQRTLGWKPGLITFFGDCVKALLACWIGLKLTGSHAGAMFAGVFVILGHNWPVFFHFKGGKGVASSCGVMLFCFPVPAIICYIVTIAVIALTRFVSLGSMILLTLYAILVSVFWSNGNIWIILWSVFLAALCIYRHRANIARLLSGTENKLGKK